VLLGSIGVVVLLVLLCGWRVASAQKALRDAEQALLEAKAAIAETRTDDAAVALSSAEDSLDRARSHATGFPLGLTRPVPLLGSPAQAVVDVSAAGKDLVAAGQVINDAAASFPTSATLSLEGHDLSEVRVAALESLAAVERAETHVADALDRIDGPTGALLPFVSRPARAMRGTVADGADTLDGADRGLALLAELAAPNTDMRLLVVAQDSMELRPSGGYIGSWGILEIRGGKANLSDYQASEDLLRPEPRLTPPADIAPGYVRWMLEDAGWWPHFPTSAASIAEVFAAQGGGDVDGVLALTEYALADLIGALGPITVPGYDEPVTQEGFAQRVLYEVELKRPLDVPRKRFLIELSEIVFDRVLSVSGDETPAVAAAVAEAVGAGDIQLWFRDEHHQERIEPLAVSGSLPTTDRDFLMLVDANLTIGKANADLVKDVEYVVRRNDDGQLEATLSMTVRNEGEETAINPHYAGFQRVYVPLGSTLLAATARDEGPATDGPYQVFSFDVFVEPGEEQRYQVRYELPDSVAPSGDYQLTWVRQVGTPKDRFTARIGGRTYSTEARTLVVDASMSRNRVAEWVRDRWLWDRFLG
jgi:hypothetical protein